MFCPQCLGEYREGFTTCASCQVELVASLPREALAKIEERRHSGTAERLTSLLHRAAGLSPGVWAVMICLIANAAVFGLALTDFFGHKASHLLSSWSNAGIVLRAVLVAGLPLVAAISIFLQKRWARVLCLLAFLVGFVQSLSGLMLVLSLAPPERSVLDSGVRFSAMYLWRAWLSGSLVLHLAGFFAVYRYGLGRGEPVKIGDVFD